MPSSKHIRVLEHAGLVQREVRGRDHMLSLNPQPMDEARVWMEDMRQFWSSRLDALECMVDAQTHKEGTG
jgi:DNA-binding transcriptional ArsR family regulator